MRIRETAPSYYGWRTIGAAHLGVMLGFALYASTFSVFVKPLASSFGWSREAIAGGFGISALAAAGLSPLIGGWLDRHPPRAILIAGISAFGCAFLGLGFLTHYIWHFYLVCFVIGAVGNVMQMGYTQAVSTWFTDRRGTAFGVMLAGEGIGIILFPIASQKLIAALGWRLTYTSMGIFILTASLPAALLYGRSNPQGDIRRTAEQGMKNTLMRILGTYTFWIIVAVLFLSSISVNGALTHQVPLLTDRGLPGASAAMTVSVLGASSLTGRLVGGWLLDRVRGALLGCALLLLAAIGIALLARAHNFSAGCVAASLLGIGAGGTSSTTPYLLTRYFGLGGFSTLYGLTWTFYAIAGGAGPVLLGLMYDRTGSYQSTLTLLAVITAVGALLMLLLPAYGPVSKTHAENALEIAPPYSTTH